MIIELTCENCGRVFKRRRSAAYRTSSGASIKHHFCSRSCYREWAKKHPAYWRKKSSYYLCDYCGKRFYRAGSSLNRGAKHIFCSMVCYRKWRGEKARERRAWVSCDNCGKKILRLRTELERFDLHFCCNKCRCEFWKSRTRGRSTSRRRGKRKEKSCAICGFNRYVEACHIVPRSVGGLFEDDNVIYLCPNHHRLFDWGRTQDNLRGELTDDEFKKIKKRVMRAYRKYRL